MYHRKKDENRIGIQTTSDESHQMKPPENDAQPKQGVRVHVHVHADVNVQVDIGYVIFRTHGLLIIYYFFPFYLHVKCNDSKFLFQIRLVIIYFWFLWTHTKQIDSCCKDAL